MAPLSPAQRRALLIGAPIALAIALVFALVVSRHHAPTKAASSAPPPPAGGGTTTPSGSPPQSALLPPGLSGPIPKGFVATDLTWTSETHGWAIGTAPCATAPCTSVVRTVDGGRTWHGGPAPTAYLPKDLTPAHTPVDCATVPCVAHLRFADEHHGYAFGPSLFTTDDGGQTWRKLAGAPVESLEVAAGLAIRVNSQALQCEPGCTFTTQLAQVGSDTWRSLANPPLGGMSATVVLTGQKLIYVAATQHVAGGASDAHTSFLRSADQGRTWQRFADPCGASPGGAEDDAVSAAGASGGVFAVLCRPRGAATSTDPGPFTVTSSDGARTFGPRHVLPAAPGAPDASARIMAAGSSKSLGVAFDGGSPSAPGSVMVSGDGGVTWQTTLTPSPADRAPGLETTPYLGFQDANTARAIVDPRTVETSSDGGRHWSATTFRSTV